MDSFRMRMDFLFMDLQSSIIGLRVLCLGLKCNFYPKVAFMLNQTCVYVQLSLKRVFQPLKVETNEHLISLIMRTIYAWLKFFIPTYNNNWICRGIRTKNSLSMYIMGLKPKLRTRGRSRKVDIVKGTYVSKWRSQFWS